jgi:hypothetical protein
LACAALTGCGTVANTAIAGYESNIATNQIAAGQNVLNAKVFALCMTPWYDIVQSPVQYQQGIEKMCVKSSATTNAMTMIQGAQIKTPNLGGSAPTTTTGVGAVNLPIPAISGAAAASIIPNVLPASAK